MLLFPLNFCFHPASRRRPVVKNLLGLLITTLLRQLSVLGFKPHGFKLLFYNSVSGVVVEVRGTAFEPILSAELHWLHILILVQNGRVEGLEGVAFD